MPIISWSDDLVVGHHIIDEQHKTLVELLNKLALGLERDDDQKALLKTFLEVHRYAAYHFDDEEDLMKCVDFDTWHVHRYEHQQFLAVIENLVEDFRAKRATIGPDILSYLLQWHLDHISKSDRELVAVLGRPKVSKA